MSLAHRRLWLAAHSRALVVPVGGVVFLVGGLFSGPTDWHEAWATGCAVVGAFAAWIVVAIDRAVPDPADAMLTARAGGASARRAAQLVLVVEVAILFAVLLVVLPEVAGVLLPAPSALAVAVGALAVFVSAAFGGALGLLLGRPVRGGTAFAAVILVYVGFAAVMPVAPAIAGPVGVGRELSISGDAPLSTGYLMATTVTLAYVFALIAFRRAVARWTG